MGSSRQAWVKTVWTTSIRIIIICYCFKSENMVNYGCVILQHRMILMIAHHHPCNLITSTEINLETVISKDADVPWMGEGREPYPTWLSKTWEDQTTYAKAKSQYIMIMFWNAVKHHLNSRCSPSTSNMAPLQTSVILVKALRFPSGQTWIHHIPRCCYHLLGQGCHTIALAR